MILQRLFQLASLEGAAALLVGMPLISIGGVLLVWSVLLFRRAGTHLEPNKPTTALVVTGPYRVTRNPIYVGFSLVHAGAALWSGQTWALILLPIAMIGVKRLVIDREELYLEHLYGEEYLRYKASVRRWL